MKFEIKSNLVKNLVGVGGTSDEVLFFPPLVLLAGGGGGLRAASDLEAGEVTSASVSEVVVAVVSDRVLEARLPFLAGLGGNVVGGEKEPPPAVTSVKEKQNKRKQCKSTFE